MGKKRFGFDGRKPWEDRDSGADKQQPAGNRSPHVAESCFTLFMSVLVPECVSYVKGRFFDGLRPLVLGVEGPRLSLAALPSVWHHATGGYAVRDERVAYAGSDIASEARLRSAVENLDPQSRAVVLGLLDGKTSAVLAAELALPMVEITRIRQLAFMRIHEAMADDS